MKSLLRMTVTLCVSSIGLWPPVPADAAANLTRLRYSTNTGKTRVVIDASRRCDYDVASYANPDRIAINIRGASATRSLTNLSIGKGGVRRVRVNRLSWGTQVVVDLDGPTSWKHFFLARNGSKPDRIVLDIHPRNREPAVAKIRPDRTGTPTRSASVDRPIIVAIDAGHGGKDGGTLGRYGLVEKKLTLDISRRVAREINKQPGVKAVLIRKTDVYISPERRMPTARELGADVFVSIHLNAAKNRSARGTEIFFVSPRGAARSANKLLANPNKTAHEYGLSGASSDLLHMLVDMNEQSVLQRSEQLAEAILEAMSRPGLLPTRAVKQKSFQVVRTIAMPSVLVEVGFISNSADAKLVREPAGRDSITRAISKGVVRFLRASPPTRADGESLVLHRVRRGETLWKISRKYGTTVSRIRETNRLRSSVLRVGQELLVSKGY